MAFIKGETAHPTTRTFSSFPEAQKVFEDASLTTQQRIDALDYMIQHQEIYYILDQLSQLFVENNLADHPLIDYAFSQFTHKPKREKDYEALFQILKSENAYLRNAAITFLQSYGKEVEPFLNTLLHDPDKDVRIFAINILGDVRFEDSVELLRTLLTLEIANESNVNVLMTAVDYMGEIGSEDDIPLLQAIQKEFASDPYVNFGIDLAIQRIRGE